MGWDGYAYLTNKDGGKMMICRETMSRQEKIWFTKASKSVQAKAGSVDMMLRDGSLDCRACGLEIANILGVSINSEDMVSPDFIREKIKGLDLIGIWAYDSALMFLKGCVRFGYSFLNVW